MIRNYFDCERIKKDADTWAEKRFEYEEQKKKDREEFLSLLLDDEVIKNNRKLQEKYMELYDKFGINSLKSINAILSGLFHRPFTLSPH